MTPLAEKYGLDYSLEVVAPGSSAPQIAVQLVSCGTDVLSGLRYPDSVPTADRRVAKAVAKAIQNVFVKGEGRRAAIFLAQAVSILMAEMTARDGEPASSASHTKLGALVQAHFTLDAADRDCLDEMGAEYRVMDDHEIEGRVPATGWYMALNDPEFAEGRDPDTDPELRTVQLRYASRYLRLQAERHAIAICLGDAVFESVAASLFHPQYSTEWEALQYDLADLNWWLGVMDLWRDAGLRAIAAELA